MSARGAEQPGAKDLGARDLAPRGPSVPEDLEPPAPADIVPLAHPLRLGGRRVRAIAVAPPRLGVLAALRSAEAIEPLMLLAALTEAPLDLLAALRWPDVEAILERGLPLLPPDLAALLSPPAEPAVEEPAASVDEPAAVATDAEPDEAGTDEPGAEEILDPSDFLISG